MLLLLYKIRGGREKFPFARSLRARKNFSLTGPQSLNSQSNTRNPSPLSALGPLPIGRGARIAERGEEAYRGETPTKKPMSLPPFHGTICAGLKYHYCIETISKIYS